jgi:uncharacterized membrane protein
VSNLTLSEYQKAEEAASRDESRRGFAVHLWITVAVWLILIAVNVFVAAEFPWSVFPVVGMAVGLYAHWYFGVTHVEASVRERQHEIERRANM